MATLDDRLVCEVEKSNLSLALYDTGQLTISWNKDSVGNACNSRFFAYSLRSGYHKYRSLFRNREGFGYDTEAPLYLAIDILDEHLDPELLPADLLKKGMLRRDLLCMCANDARRWESVTRFMSRIEENSRRRWRSSRPSLERARAWLGKMGHLVEEESEVRLSEGVIGMLSIDENESLRLYAFRPRAWQWYVHDMGYEPCAVPSFENMYASIEYVSARHCALATTRFEETPSYAFDRRSEVVFFRVPRPDARRLESMLEIPTAYLEERHAKD